MKKKLYLAAMLALVLALVITACNNETPPDPITIAAIPGVTAPATGATPVTAITATAQYTGTVAWNNTLDDGKFKPGTAYTATITLTPKAGFTLEGVTANFFTVAGATSTTNAANSGTVQAVFPATQALAGIETLSFTNVQLEKLTTTLEPIEGIGELPVPSFSNYTGALTLSTEYNGGGTGSVASGKFSFTLDGEPDWLDSMYGEDGVFGCDCDDDATYHDPDNDHGFLDWLFVIWTPYEDVTASVPDAEGWTLYDIKIADDGGKVYKGNQSTTINGTNITIINENVNYMYVDQDVTITAAQAVAEPGFQGIPVETTFPALNLELKEGWNFVKRTLVINIDLGANPPTTMTGSATFTFSLGDSVKWIYEEAGD